MATFIWLGLFAAFIIIEAATAQLVTVWFAVGAFCSFIASFITESIAIQLLIFIAVSAIALLVTRPLVRRLTSAKRLPTNADMYIGEEGLSLEKIDNLSATGLVKVKGSLWTARSFDDSLVIEKNTPVIVERIEGVKLIVRPKS